MPERLWDLLVNLLVIIDFVLEFLARLAVVWRG